MGLLDIVAAPSQRVAYLFPEVGENGAQFATNGRGGFQGQSDTENLFVFQFWPSQVTDSYTPNYATKQIPGASHPLLQYTSGAGRNISFTANFVAEVRENSATLGQSFNERVAGSAAGSSTSIPQSVGASFLPSSRYTVNVSGALAALQQYLYPSYGERTATSGIVKPPSKLVLVLPGTKLGRADGADGILCVLKAANVTMESWFPSGQLRAASVALQFAEIIQLSSAKGSNIRYIGSEAYSALASTYLTERLVGNPTDLSL